MPGDEDAPPAPEEWEAPAQTQTPAGFWPDLVAAVRQEMRPPVSGFFTTTPTAPVLGSVSGDQVVLRCANKFALEMINKPEILALVSRKASAILGRPVRAVELCSWI